jgi:hypothetical protein
VPRALLGTSLSLLLALVASTSRAQTSHAQPAEPARAVEHEITIVPSSCAELPWSGVSWEELLVIELSGDGTKAHITTRERSASALPDAASPRLSLELDHCAASAAQVTITLDVGPNRAQRTLALTQLVASARARAVAIAAAELVHSTPLEVPERVAPPPPPPPIAPIVVPQKHMETPPSVAIFAAGEARLFPEGDATLFGARLGTRVPLVAWTALGLDAGAMFGSADDPLGTVKLTLASIGVSALAVARTRGFNLAIGPRFELGPGWFRGQALAPTTLASTAVAPIALASITAAASFRFAGDVGGVVALDGGAAVYGYGARADDRSVAGLRGPMLSVRLGLAWDRDLQ